MKSNKVLLSAAIVSLVAVATVSTTAFAWHPKGVIVKKVQNITTNSALADADTSAQAIAAKPGDTLKYVIEVRNDGAADSKGYNDMAKTVMTDTLPAGVELVGNPAQRQITENLGLLKPGQKVTKEYTVKVTAKTAGNIENKACFTGDSTANDNPQSGCNPAVIKVTVPTVPVVTKPEEPKKPVVETKPVVQTPVELPKTGAAENVFAATIALGAMLYAISRYVISKRDLSKTVS